MLLKNQRSMYVIYKIMFGRFVHYVGHSGQWEGLIQNAKLYSPTEVFEVMNEIKTFYKKEIVQCQLFN